MSDKKQSPKKSGEDSDNGVVLFEDNIKKLASEDLDTIETEEKDAQSYQANAYMIKLVLIGDSAVGKTSIRNNFLGLGFEKEHQTTLGADFAATTQTIEGYQIKYQIWDLAGQPMFKNVRPRFFKGCFGALAVFDITRKETFHNLTNWIEELYQFSGRGVVPVIILSNKMDLENHAITVEEANEFIKELNKKTKDHKIKNFFLETSAKTGLNIDEAFRILGEYIIEKFSSDDD
ncbi:MAG: GTP-binding protein [Candidatus Heimdallarchaeota archaeon]|nr:GTP-binding protein [Candidatus Heimdallarchaeota archaeon]